MSALPGISAPGIYCLTGKGRNVLGSAVLFGLSHHLRDLLKLCDPAMRVEHARQFLPPESLHIALYALQQLELIDGPPIDAPRPPTRWVT